MDRAKDGQVIGSGVRQVPALVKRILQLEAERLQWMSISFAVEEWMGGFFDDQDLRESAERALDRLAKSER